MKTFLCALASTALLFCWTTAEDDDPFGIGNDSIEKPEIPARGITVLPSAVKYKLLADDRHEYAIGGLFPLDEDADLDNSASHAAALFEFVFPEGVKVKVNFTPKALTLETSRPVPYDTLAFAVDGLAIGGGELPTWDEMAARDLKKSETFSDDHYEIVEIKEDFPSGLAWFWFGSDEEMALPFVVHHLNELGTVRFTPTTSHCMCFPRFAIRISDRKDRVVWEMSDPGVGRVLFALADLNADHSHEIYLDLTNHGKKRRVAIRPKSEQVEAANP